MIQPTRIRNLNHRKIEASGEYVLYWMQQSQRISFNHAWQYAVREADFAGKPLVVLFCIIPDYPQANSRHFRFMLQGLKELREEAGRQGVRFIITIGNPVDVVPRVAERASLCVVDRGYLRHQRQWRADIAQRLDVQMIGVESDCIVPVEDTSGKEEYGAYTIRPKITRLLHEYLVPLETEAPEQSGSSLEIDLPEVNLDDIEGFIAGLGVEMLDDSDVVLTGGYSHAIKLLQEFVKSRLQHYDTLRNHPELDYQSELSPYIHFGQISTLEIALAVRAQQGNYPEAVAAFLEELIVRRELSMNFVFYNAQYDSLANLPEWAVETLADHADDERPYLYDMETLEDSATHDEFWNAAQRQMVRTGKMHGYMRMYWGKKILEWSAGVDEAYRRAIYLNDKYSLDGRDANGYAGVAWCFGKHDRPWKERAVFGKVRYMNDKGLMRKFDMSAYLRRNGDIQ